MMLVLGRGGLLLLGLLGSLLSLARRLTGGCWLAVVRFLVLNWLVSHGVSHGRIIQGKI